MFEQYRLKYLQLFYRFFFSSILILVSVHTILGTEIIPYIGYTGLALLFPGLFKSNLQKHERFFAHFSLMILISIPFSVSLFTGGTDSPAFFWILTIPAVSAFLISRIGAFVYTGVTIFMFIVVMALEANNYLAESVFAKVDGFKSKAFAFFITVIFLSFFFQRVRKLLDRSLNDLLKNKKLKDLAYDIFNATNDYIGVADIKGKSLYVNKSYANLLRNSSRKIGDSITAYHPEWVVDRMLNEAIPYAIENGIWTGRSATFDNKNNEVPVLQTLVAHKNDKGETYKLSTIMKDITALEKNEKRLIEAEREASLANRAKSEFLANMSHEIRTPLNGIIGAIDLLDGDNLTTDQKDMLETLSMSSDHLLTILNDILDIAKIEAGKMTVDLHRVSLKDILNSINSIYSPIAEAKGLELKIEAPAYDINFTSDSVKIKQILSNLISNAIKFTNTGFVKVCAQESDNFIQFDVVDTGKGIKESNLQLLFNKFTQEDATIRRQYGGTGLGLTISQNLVELLGGEIHLKSQPGTGAQFTFHLPKDLSSSKAA